MPNPLRALKRTDKLTPRQKAIVRELRRRGLPVKVYHRKGSRSGVSVHNPLLDVRKHARLGTKKKVQRYPQAYDTADQRRVRSAKPKGVKGKARKVRKSVAKKRFLLP